MSFNPLLHIGHYSVRRTKISILKLEGIIKKISYESVDDNSLSRLREKEVTQQGVNSEHKIRKFHSLIKII